jgi:hypothetical protein
LEFWEDAFEGSLTPGQQEVMQAAVKPLGDLTDVELLSTIAIGCGKSRANQVYEQYYLDRVCPPGAPQYRFTAYTRWPMPEPPGSHKNLVDEMTQPLLAGITLFGSSAAGDRSGTRVILLTPIK